MKPPPLRILWITNMFYEEGSGSFRGIFVSQMWESLLATGEVHLDLEVVAQGRGRIDYLWANRRVRARWNAGRYDLAHVHYGLTSLATMMLPRRTPLVHTFYGSDINSRLQRTISFSTARNSSRRIFVSKRLSDRWPSPSNIVLPNGVDFSRCFPMDRTGACVDLGLDPNSKWVLFGGLPSNLVKGYALFQEVLNRVRRWHPDAKKLILSGRGQPYESVVKKLNAADVLLFTSRRGSEGSPTVVKEALAVGLPVVSVDVGDVPEMLEDVVPGAVVNWPSTDSPEDRESWFEELARRTSDVLAQNCRSNGREKRAFLRQPEITRRMIEIYREVASGTSRG